MNLQTLSVILIIIVLPITLVLSAYTQMQIDTLALQTRLRTQLKNATYDAVVAFQLNTVQNEFSTVSDSMRRDVSAAIQSFMTNLAGNIGMSGATENTLKPYIPAIVFTLYDGYYIYSPSKSTIVDKNGKTKVTYEHVLKPYIYYTVRYVKENEDTDVIVNYSLDNYIVVTGKVKGQYVTKAGYLEVLNDEEKQIKDGKENNGRSLLESNLTRNLPVTTVFFKDNTNNRSSVKNIGNYQTDIAKVNITTLNTNFKDIDITDRLSNGVLINDPDIFPNITQLKLNRLYEEHKIDYANGKIQLNRSIIEGSKELGIEGSNGLMADRNYHWIIRNMLPTGKEEIEHKFAEDGEYNVGFYIAPSTNAYYVPADSAQQYYKGNAENDGAESFTDWVINNLGNLTPADARKADGKKYAEFENKNHHIFQIDINKNDPEKEDSLFNDHREEVIKASIKDNLSQAIASYSENSEELGSTSNFQLPVLSDVEWHQILTNVCFITFMQGIQVGTKMFNDYCIVTSTKNKEYVSPDSIYYVNLVPSTNNKNPDAYKYYHKLGCKLLENANDENEIIGYRNSEFDKKVYEIKAPKPDNPLEYEDQNRYYFMHSYKDKEDGNEYVYEACYYCIVTKADNSLEDWRNSINKRMAYYKAMAREKFNFYKTNSYFKTSKTE